MTSIAKLIVLPYNKCMGKTEELPQEQPERQVRRHIASSHPRNSFWQQLQRAREEVGSLKTAKHDEEKDIDKKKRKKREKIREPNLVGGGLAIVAIFAVFLLVRAYSQNSPRVVGAKIENKKADNKVVLEARQRVESNVQKQIEGVKKQAENINVKDAAAPRVNKVLDDLEATKELPKQLSDVKDQGTRVVGNAVTIIGRLQKIVQDASGIKDVIMEKMREL